MRYLIIALALLLGPALPAQAQLSLDIGGRGFNIGINMPVYPRLVLIPGYPVYYDPDVSSNYFFYDGLYWVFVGDNWYASTWYNGPWELVPPEEVPQFLLLVPVRYYRAPPIYFRSWAYDRAPRWGEHWGRGWEQRRAGWDRWDRRSMPAAAPLPVYQRQYSGSRYPRAIEQQQTIQAQNYRYQPRDAVAQQHFRQGSVQAPTNAGRTRVQTPTGPQASPQYDQRRVQVDRQRQQTQQGQQAQQQQSTQVPTQRMRQERPVQSAVQNQRIQNGPQERGPVNAGPQGRGVETRSAPRETQAAVQGPQGRGGGEHRGPPEATGGQQQSGGGPQGGRGENRGEKGAREGKVREDKKD